MLWLGDVSVHQGEPVCGLAAISAAPGFIDRPDLGALVASVVVEAPVAADKEQRTGMAKGTGKLVGALGDVHADDVIKPDAIRMGISSGNFAIPRPSPSNGLAWL